MSNTGVQSNPVRIGIYTSLEAADGAVSRLLVEGFTKDQITVICSDEAKESHFREFEHQEPAGENTPVAAATGGAIGAVLGGLTAVAAGAATGGVGLLVAGGAAAWTGGVLGGFLGAMMTRGTEKEASDYYAAAVTGGKILVAVEVHGQGADIALARAEQILADMGAQPLALPEG